MLRAYRLALSLRDRLRSRLERLARTAGRTARRTPARATPRFVPGIEALERIEATNALYSPLGGVGLGGVLLPQTPERTADPAAEFHVAGLTRAGTEAGAPASSLLASPYAPPELATGYAALGVTASRPADGVPGAGSQV